MLRLRHPEGKQIRQVTIDGLPWKDLDRQKEWIRIPNASRDRYSIVASY
jgi:hypothetical protein